MSPDVHAINDLVKALCKGDPNELVPLDVVTAMATAAIQAHWIECPHLNFTTERSLNLKLITHACDICGARMTLEDTDG